MSTLLITLPQHDQTMRYISTWAKSVVSEAEQRNIGVFGLHGPRASRKEVESMLMKHKPSLVFLNGHGNVGAVTGHDDKPIVEVGENEHVLEKTITYALACSSAKILGKESVRCGARAYLGYQKDFIFLYTEQKRTRPDTDHLARLFLDPSNQIVISLLKNHTVHESLVKGKICFSRNMQKMLTSQTSQEDTAALRYLYWNMSNLVYHGDGTAKI